jgi:hypothetical protein
VVLTAPQRPWQNPFVERLIGSVRRECLAHVFILGERHLRRILTTYFAYYHEPGLTSRSTRTHPTDGQSSRRSSARSSPFPKSVVCIIATSDARRRSAAASLPRCRPMPPVPIFLARSP